MPLCQSIALYFNPRSPCGERHLAARMQRPSHPFQSTLPVRGATSPHFQRNRAFAQFQSTLPVRGATPDDSRRYVCGSDFNPRSPCGERPGFSPAVSRKASFQSTLPVRGATHVNRATDLAIKFQSTLPVRGATYTVDQFREMFTISIHAPRAGSDRFPAPCITVYFRFQSTLPVRGATVCARN